MSCSQSSGDGRHACRQITGQWDPWYYRSDETHVDLTREAAGSHQQTPRGHRGAFHRCLEWVLFTRPPPASAPAVYRGRTQGGLSPPIASAPSLCSSPCCRFFLAPGCLQSCRRWSVLCGVSCGILLPMVPCDKCDRRERPAEDLSSPQPPSDTSASSSLPAHHFRVRTVSVHYRF